MLEELLRKNRSYRRFDESVPVSIETLRELIDLTRLAASGANRQPLKYFLSCDPETNGKIFPHTRWAGYLEDWKGPADGERPTAFVIMLGDRDVSSTWYCDHGLAAQAIMLGATERGLGGCIIGSFDKKGILRDLGIDGERFDLLLVLAIGKPGETVVLEDVGPDGDIRYFRDEEGVHHVPKRPLEELILTSESEEEPEE